MSESIFTALLGLAGVGVGYLLNECGARRPSEEEERRRKSDRKLELYRRDLEMVSDLINATMEAIAKISWEQPEGVDAIKVATVLAWRTYPVSPSLKDRKLKAMNQKLVNAFYEWFRAIDLQTAKPKEGTKEEDIRALRWRI